MHEAATGCRTTHVHIRSQQLSLRAGAVQIIQAAAVSRHRAGAGAGGGCGDAGRCGGAAETGTRPPQAIPRPRGAEAQQGLSTAPLAPFAASQLDTGWLLTHPFMDVSGILAWSRMLSLGGT